MKLITATDEMVTIELSRRNLLSLLAKLDGHPPDSARTIFSNMQLPFVFIKAVEDAEHYSDRPAGAMVDGTEEHIGHPGYPNGRCPTCGHGLDAIGMCDNNECTDCGRTFSEDERV